MSLAAPGGASAEFIDEADLREDLRRETGSPNDPSVAHRVVELGAGLKRILGLRTTHRQAMPAEALGSLGSCVPLNRQLLCPCSQGQEASTLDSNAPAGTRS
jgi:hypothetical protein